MFPIKLAQLQNSSQGVKLNVAVVIMVKEVNLNFIENYDNLFAVSSLTFPSVLTIKEEVCHFMCQHLRLELFVKNWKSVLLTSFYVTRKAQR